MTLSRTNPRAKPRWFALGGAVTLMLVLLATAVLAGHPEVSLAGSNFEIDTDANLKVDDTAPPSIDWGNVNETRQGDLASGTGDDSFGQGSKEDTPVPTVVAGSIPPNKSDLLNFGVYLEENASGRFLNLFWHRVQEPSGTTNMDFEFNKSDVISANGVTPVRTAGDLLIQYDLSQGGTNPVLFVSQWVTEGASSQCEAANKVPCWGTRVNLSDDGEATGSINTSAIPAAESDGLGDISPRTFGEAQLDFDALVNGSASCESFGSAYLKSRSSDSFTAAMKDFIAPTTLDLDNCGSVTIRKVTDPEGADATFGYTHNLSTDPVLEDDPATLDINESTQFTLQHGDSVTYDVLFGTGYTVNEDDLPDGWDFDNVDCSASNVTVDTSSEPLISFDIENASDVVDCTYTNIARGTIIVEKITDDGDGAFGFLSDALGPFTLTTTDAGDVGKDSKTFSDLVPGTYDVAEDVPTGWNLVSSSCDDESDPASIELDAGETVTCTFHDARQLGAIEITKTRKHAATPSNSAHAGVKFTITGGDLPVGGVEVTTDSAGLACADELLLSSFVGDYTVTEEVPAGYVADGDEAKTVSITTESACGDGNEAEVSFANTPLTDITVNVDSQVDGGTASVISCVDADGSVYGGSTGADGDAELTVEDLLPTDPAVTLTCTIIVDP
jgi:hypothetical protein